MSIIKISYKIAFGGLMAALSVAILSLSSFIPVLTYAAPLFAGILLVPVIAELGLKWGWMVWTAVSLLSVLLLADKEAAAFYVFTGYYPMVKPIMEKIKPAVLKFMAKLAVFSLSVGIMYLLLIYVLKLEAVISEFKAAGRIINMIYFVVMIMVMMIYDILLYRVEIMYRKRIKPKMKINLKMILLFLIAGLAVCGRTENSYAATKAVTYFGDEWPVNFLNSEHDGAEQDFERIKADGFNTVIYCVPWREIQPGSNGGFDEDALRKLDEMISRAGASGLAVMLRLGYTWDFADSLSSLNRFNSLVRDSREKGNWLKYAERIYRLASAHSNFAGAFITWEDFWTSLGQCGYSFDAMDRKLNELLVQTQTVFPNLSMECRLHNDMSGGRIYSHEATFGCGNSAYSSAMLAASMGFQDGSVVDPGSAVQMSSQMISRMQAAGKPVFIDQFLYMETTPGYENLPGISDVNAYLSAMGDVFRRQTMGYGIWTYKDYADSIIYNPEFGRGTKGWKCNNAYVVDVNGNNKAYLVKGSSISQDLTGRGFNNSGSTKAQITVDSEEKGRINITAGGEVRSADIVPGSQTITIDFGKQVKSSITISTSVPAYIDNVKLYSHITEGDIYKLNGAPGQYLAGIRELNRRL